MKRYSYAALIEAICSKQSINGILEDNSVKLKIQNYSPMVCLAIHDGHQIRPELLEYIALDESERLYEEDPLTSSFIQSFPIQFIACDSRFEYDLNRTPENAIYEEAWGTKVWKKNLPDHERDISLTKHARIVEIIKALVRTIRDEFGYCLVFDIHSYNYKRINKPTPIFNIGTYFIDEHRWKIPLKYLTESLSTFHTKNISLDKIVSTNDVFQGKGYISEQLNSYCSRILSIPLEIKKVYMDENTGQLHPLIYKAVKKHLKKSLLEVGDYFERQCTKQRNVRPLLNPGSENDAVTKRVDKELFRLARTIEVLNYVNPINHLHEKKHFFSRKFSVNPDFTYRHLKINPFEFRESLYRLPIDDVEDLTLRHIYQDIVDSYATKIDLLVTLGTEKFLYNSLRHFGEPDISDIRTAQFIMYAPALDVEAFTPITLSPDEVMHQFQAELDYYNIEGKVEFTTKILANALVDNAKRTVLINSNATFSASEVEALIHHEIGIHLLTTKNAEIQPLQFLRLGLPGNTHTQEGLAILSEYLSGHFPLQRLRIIALRVLAVRELIKGREFKQTFQYLIDAFGIEPDQAFNIVARVYRGGGFTKDFLYLRGFKDALRHYERNQFRNLLIGKTSFNYLSDINELIERKILNPPKYFPRILDTPAPLHPIMAYLVRSIR
ncbi:MAG: flavohemoglobin expression-modulating QEGLA motif protein [Pseudomonadota bacterium]